MARGDLWLVGSRMLHEYDGEGTATGPPTSPTSTVTGDCSRPAGTAAATPPLDLLHRPEAILREADETLGRRHRVDRLDPWRVAVAESLFHPAGRARLAVRLGGPASGRSGPREAG